MSQIAVSTRRKPAKRARSKPVAQSTRKTAKSVRPVPSQKQGKPGRAEASPGAPGAPQRLAAADVLALQQTLGNQSVQRMLANRPRARQSPLLQRDDAPDTDAEKKAEEEKVAIPTAIGYIGMNPAAAKEAKALKRVSKDQVLISLDDPKTQKNLSTNEGMGVFIYKQLGIDPTKNIVKFISAFNALNTAKANARDQLGHLMKWFSGAEQDKYRIERLVLSGHSDGVDLWGESDSDHDPGKFLLHRELANVAAVFPKAAGQVQDIMFSACWSVVAIKKMSEIFPNLQTAWGYIGFSPSIKQGSARHIKKWEMTTRGDKTPEKRDRRGKAAIWTRDKGYVAGDPGDYNLQSLKDAYNAMTGKIGLMISGDEKLDGQLLGNAYLHLQVISIHPDTDPKTVKQTRKLLELLLRLRFWNLIVTTFMSTHAGAIKKAYKGFPISQPGSAVYKDRKKLKEHIDSIKAELGKKENAAMRDYLDKLLKPGLWDLDPSVIPDEWI